MSDGPVAFHDIAADDYPFLMEAIDQTGRVVWSLEVTGPGAVHIPGLAAFYGPVTCRVTTARGDVVEAQP